MFIFTGFSEKANAALNNAVHFAEDMGHTYVGSEHILAGLLKDTSSVAGIILSSQRLTFRDFSEVLRNDTGAGIPTSLTDSDITPRAGQIIRNAMEVASDEGTGMTGTDHLLKALLRENGCSANRILEKMGYSPYELLSAVSGESPLRGDGRRGREFRDEPVHAAVKTLEKYGVNLTLSAKAGKIDPVVGRDREIDRVMRILCRRTKNNPCLIGEPGVGKTAIAEGLAYRTAVGDVPERLKNMQIYSLELTAMVAGAKYRGDFEERIRNAVNEAQSAGNIILFIDEIHNLIGAGSAEGAVDAANILKPVLARGKIKLIGATTAEEYRRNIEKDAALERRFQTVNIEEPSMEDCLTILKSIRPSYEKFHRVKISDEALSAAVEMSVRYITDRFLPDKAIDLVDEAAAGLNMKRGRMSEEEIHLEENLRRAGKEKINAVSSGDFEKAAVFREKERAAANELLMKRAEKKDVNEDSPVLLPEHIASEVSSRTKIPVGKLCESDAGRLSSLEEKLGEAVIGQEDAVKRVAFAVRRSRAGLSDPERPVGTFLFSGPSGVGKTALAKALAECVFGSKDAMIKLDMSEYTEKHSLSRLIGAPPGYTGFDDGGQLVNKIRRMPYSVLLFDEIEKAHPDTFGFLLPVLEEGILTASDGKKADCRNCIIIMTSNAGASKAGESPGGMGFYEDTDENRKKRIEEDIFGELKNIFPPEFRGRIDDIIVFQRLSEKSIGKIAVRQLDEIKLRLKKQGISLITDDSVSEFLGKKGNDKNYGARNLRRLIRTEIEDPVSSLIYEKPGIREIKCTCTDGKLSFSL